MAEIVSSADFQSMVLDSSVPVVVDFFATWCMPCKMLSPILEDLIAEVGEKAKIVKVDIDKEPELANSFNVRSVPTLVFMKDGKMVDQILGAVPLPVIMERLGKLL